MRERERETKREKLKSESEFSSRNINGIQPKRWRKFVLALLRTQSKKAKLPVLFFGSELLMGI